MSVRIIKSSTLARIEREKEKERSKCPECGNKKNLGIYHTETRVLTFKERNIYRYTCLCGCEYEITGEWNKLGKREI